MGTKYVALATAILASLTLCTAQAAEPKHGGILHIYHRETPPSLSIHEEATFSVNAPAMAIFNNLIIYDQHKPQTSVDTIVPELATSWAWDKANTALTFKLRAGVKWHDGQPFTAKDVKCTFDLLQGKAQDKFRKNPRKDWYEFVNDVSVNGDNEVTFHLKRPQPSLLAMLASGYTPIYPCHVPAAQMRTHPIGTGPFKFVEMKQNELIKLVKNPDYWKKGLPYLDGIEYTIIKNRATAVLAFVAGKVDMTFPTEMTAALEKDIKSQDPKAICEIKPINVNTNLIVNLESPPFNNPELRKAMMLSLDRKAFIDIILQGQGDQGGSLLPPPEGVWGLPPDILKTIPGYGDVKKDREQARAIMTKFGYCAGQAAQDQSVDAQSRDLSRSGGGADRPAQEHLHRRRARSGRIQLLVRQGGAQGLPGRPQPDRQRHRRSRPGFLRELFVRVGAQLHALLQQGSGEAVRSSNRPKPISPSARSWCGKSTRRSRRTARGRSCSTPAPARAGSLTSRT